MTFPHIVVRCPKCGRSADTHRQPHDYPGTHTVVLLCPECSDGDFGNETYFDADGNQLETPEL